MMVMVTVMVTVMVVMVMVMKLADVCLQSQPPAFWFINPNCFCLSLCRQQQTTPKRS